jgi:hypothetical protein
LGLSESEPTVSITDSRVELIEIVIEALLYGAAGMNSVSPKPYNVVELRSIDRTEVKDERVYDKIEYLS